MDIFEMDLSFNLLLYFTQHWNPRDSQLFVVSSMTTFLNFKTGFLFLPSREATYKMTYARDVLWAIDCQIPIYYVLSPLLV